MSFADRLAEALRHKGITSNALSQRLGISSTAVWNWMHGNTNPRPDMLHRAAAELGVDAGWLMGGDDRADPTISQDVGSAPTVAEILADARARLSESLKMPFTLELRIVG